MNKFLEHKMTLLITGFLLTSILGTWLSHSYEKGENERARKNDKIIQSRIAIQGLSTYMYERRVRSELLYSSFERSAPLEEIKSRKKDYDESYVNWNTHLKSNLFTIRNILDTSDYTIFEYLVENKLVSIFRDIDSCLTNAYDLTLKNESNIIDYLKECDTQRKIQLALDCSYEITDQLYQIVDIVAFETENEIISKSFESEEYIGQRCTDMSYNSLTPVSSNTVKEIKPEYTKPNSRQSVINDSNIERIQQRSGVSEKWIIPKRIEYYNPVKFYELAPEGWSFVKGSVIWHFEPSNVQVRSSKRIIYSPKKITAEIWVGDRSHLSEKVVINGYMTYKLVQD